MCGYVRPWLWVRGYKRTRKCESVRESARLCCVGVNKRVPSLLTHLNPFTRPREADARLRERILALSFVSFDELDIREVGEEFRPSWEFAANELRKMNGFRTPRDKLVCVLNCCRVLTNLLASSRGDDNPPGADELLPALILTVIRANPDHMHSNLNFIAQFRHPGKLVSEPGYFFTHVLSAVTFIETIHADALSLGEDEFARRVQDASARHGVDPAPILGRARLQGRRDSVDSVTAAERMREARARATSEEMEGEGAPHSDTGATASEGQTRGEDGPGSSSSSSSAGPARGNEERGGDAGRAGALARAAHDAVSQLGSSPPPLVPAISSSAERELVRVQCSAVEVWPLSSVQRTHPLCSPYSADAVAVAPLPLCERERGGPARGRALLPPQGVQAPGRHLRAPAQGEAARGSGRASGQRGWRGPRCSAVHAPARCGCGHVVHRRGCGGGALVGSGRPPGNLSEQEAWLGRIRQAGVVTACRRDEQDETGSRAQRKPNNLTPFSRSSRAAPPAPDPRCVRAWRMAQARERAGARPGSVHRGVGSDAPRLAASPLRPSPPAAALPQQNAAQGRKVRAGRHAGLWNLRKVRAPQGYGSRAAPPPPAPQRLRIRAPPCPGVRRGRVMHNQGGLTAPVGPPARRAPHPHLLIPPDLAPHSRRVKRAENVETSEVVAIKMLDKQVSYRPAWAVASMTALAHRHRPSRRRTWARRSRRRSRS